MKQNMVALRELPGSSVFLGVTPRRIRLLLLTIGAVAANLLLLTINHVSLPGLLSSYLELARGRRGYLLYGIATLAPEAKIHAGFFLPLLLLPFWIWPGRFLATIRERRLAGIGYYLLLLAAPAISIAGMLPNAL